MSQTHLSRHATGILPSKQFFTPRKPISQNTSIKHKTSFPALQNNNDQTVTTSLPIHQNINVTTKINNSTPEEDTPSSSSSSSNLQPRSSIALTTFSSNFLVDVLSSHNPTLDQSIDSILNNDGYDDSPENMITVPVRPSSAVLLTRQKNQDYGNDIISQQSTTIDSLFEPPPQGLILDPISYRPQITRTESGGVTYPLSKDLMDSSNIFAKDSNINSNNVLPPTPKKDLKPINTSENQQYIFNEFDISYMPHIVLPTKKSKKTADKNESDKVKQKKLYQVWPGRNKFFLGGRIMTSRNYLAFTVAVSTLVIPSGLFLGFTCPFLFHNVSPAVVFIFVYLFLLSLTSMLRTSWSDPGIIPRNLDSLSSMEGLDDINNAYYANNYSLLPKEIKVNGQTVRSKYCDTCKVYRPPRSSHCRQCDNCVENEDHHCIWLNNCIGKRNYRTFFTFIASATIICIYIQGFCLTHLLLLMQENKIGFIGTVIAEPVSLLLIVLAFFLMWSVGGLTCYHGYLISKNLTTHEQIRTSPSRRNGGRNPFAYNNMFVNCLWVLCRPLTHSVVNEKSFVYEESLNLGGGSSDVSVIDRHSGGQQQLSQKMQVTQVETVQETSAVLIDSNDKSSETFIKDKSNNVEEVIIDSPSLSTSSSTTLSKVQNH